MTDPTPFTLDKAIGAALLAEAEAAGPREICGIIGVDPTGAQWHCSITNIARRLADRFEMAPAEQIACFRRLRERGAEMAAIYHSHPVGEARPSAHDRAGHTYPQALALIVAPHATHGPRLRAWRLIDDTATEVRITGRHAFL